MKKHTFIHTGKRRGQQRGAVRKIPRVFTTLAEKKPQKKNKTFSFFFLFRRETTQMSSVWESVQPELQPHHTQQETHRIQTVRLRPLRQRFPEEGGPEEAQRDATWPKMNHSHRPTTDYFFVITHLPQQRTFFRSTVTFIPVQRVCACTRWESTYISREAHYLFI